MSKRKLNFATLAPERDVFTDVDGKEYEFRMMTEFGAVDLAHIHNLQKRMDAAIEAIVADAGDEKAAAMFEKLTEESLKMIVLKLPEERLGQLTLGQKAAVMQFWRESNRPSTSSGANEGEVKADQKGS